MKIDAFNLMNKAHSKDVRSDGSPFILHCVRVAAYSDIFYLPEYSFTQNECIMISYLHDVHEDHPDEYPIKLIENKFNKLIADACLDLTNEYTRVKYPNLNRDERKNLEHQRLANTRLESRFIKMCDRLDNIYSSYSLLKKRGKGYLRKYIAESRHLMDAIKSLDVNSKLHYTLSAAINDLSEFVG